MLLQLNKNKKVTIQNKSVKKFNQTNVNVFIIIGLYFTTLLK